MTRFGLILCILLIQLASLTLAGPAAAAEPATWHTVQGPTRGSPQVIGSYANGCISGAVALPPDGPGYQVIRLSRNRNFGHPHLIAYVRDLGLRIERAGLGIALIGDLAQPRGGPMNYGHASHQTGLDVDIWFRLDLPRMPVAGREKLEEVAMADARAMRLHPDRWTSKHGELVRLAASDGRVSRIFVNPAIKKALCETRWQDRSWLGKVRPWWGHAGHLHIRLLCPAGSPDCVNQAPLPAGDGCDATLESWFRPPDPGPTRPGPAVAKPPLPAACQALLSAGW